MKMLATTTLLMGLTLGAQAFAKTTEAIALLGDQTYPEGIITLPNNELLVGGFGDGSIQRVSNTNRVSYFNRSGENGMARAVGFAVDRKNRRLWVANFSFKTQSGQPGSNLKVFDYQTGKLLKTIPETFVDGAFFNELALDSKGNVYATDTFAPRIWTARYESTTPEVFVAHDELLRNPSPDQPFGLNGLSLTPGETYLLASVMNRTIEGGGKLVRIGLKDRSVKAVALRDDAATASFSGSDGMFFHRRQLVMVNVYSKAGAIFTAEFNRTYSRARLVKRDRFQSVYDRPTASTIRNGKLYTVNSQLNRIIDDRDGELNTPPELPFKVVAVPLAKLLRK